jgi:mRNA-degrading endonuclease RelE of RelBE toxin-antitoxin system
MSYNVELTPEAEDDIRRISDEDPALGGFVIGEIYTLAGDPVRLSRRAGFPHRPGQKYEFRSGDALHGFVVLFRYSQDETAIVVLAVGHVRYDKPFHGFGPDDI